MFLLSIRYLLLKLQCLQIHMGCMHSFGTGITAKRSLESAVNHSEGDDQQCSWLLKCDRIFWSLLCNLCSCCGSLFCRVLFTVFLQTQIWGWFLYTYLSSNKTTALLLIRLQHKQWCKGRSNPSEIYWGC